MVAAYLVFLGLLAVERLVELVISRRHVAWALERGGLEYGRGHFDSMRFIHTGFIIACALEVLVFKRPFYAQLGIPMLALALAAQALRYWAVLSLGRYWNVRVVVVPGAVPVTRGPYRFMRHPNYLAVILEGFAVPLVHTAWLTAIAFTTINAGLLWTRIRCEEKALAENGPYRERLGDLPRFFPTLRSSTPR